MRRRHFFGSAPATGPFKLYIGGMGGIITSASVLADSLQYEPFDFINYSIPNYNASDISVFTIDSNNNIYAELNERYCLISGGSFSAGTELNNLTYFIDLNGGLNILSSSSMNGNGTSSKLKYFYSKTAIFRGSGNPTTVHRGFRNRTANFKMIYAPFDPQIGNNVDNRQCYDLLTTSIKIFAHPDAETNNGGGVEGDIQNAITQKAAVVTYCDDIVSVPDAVSDLATANITATTVDLTFSTPSSPNSILQYEVWVDGAFWDWITASGGTVTGLTTATNYDIQIKTADIYYNISGLSNNVNFNTS